MPESIQLDEVRRLLAALAARIDARPERLRVRRVVGGQITDRLMMLKADGSLEEVLDGDR
jgi:hypothetical protein